MSALTDYVKTMPEQFQNSIFLLDQHFKSHGRTWQEMIDTDSLQMHNPRNCILGQLFSSYYKGMETLGIYDVGCDYAFSDTMEDEQIYWVKYLRLWGEDKNSSSDVVYNNAGKAHRVLVRTEKNMILADSDGTEFMVALNSTNYTTEKMPKGMTRRDSLGYVYVQPGPGSAAFNITFAADFSTVSIFAHSPTQSYISAEAVAFIAEKMKKE